MVRRTFLPPSLPIRNKLHFSVSPRKVLSSDLSSLLMFPVAEKATKPDMAAMKLRGRARGREGKIEGEGGKEGGRERGKERRKERKRGKEGERTGWKATKRV